ncbi:hypothetical protein Scep_003853 [Stephania cephalantha]|uniref:Uncharacterized protein n=1 Tax=Stephania cephalantha TaxID=152367 RepID=A0AAP0KSW3_9MAGN
MNGEKEGWTLKRQPGAPCSTYDLIIENDSRSSDEEVVELEFETEEARKEEGDNHQNEGMGEVRLVTWGNVVPEQGAGKGLNDKGDGKHECEGDQRIEEVSSTVPKEVVNGGQMNDNYTEIEASAQGGSNTAIKVNRSPRVALLRGSPSNRAIHKEAQSPPSLIDLHQSPIRQPSRVGLVDSDEVVSLSQLNFTQGTIQSGEVTRAGENMSLHHGEEQISNEEAIVDLGEIIDYDQLEDMAMLEIDRRNGRPE